MSNRVYQITGGLTEKDLKLFHRSVLTVIEKMGVKVCDKMASLLPAGHNFEVSKDRVRIKPDAVERYLDKVRAGKNGEAKTTDGYSILAPGALPFYFEEIQTAEVRPLNVDDAIASCRLVDGLYDEGLRGQAAGLPQDLPLAIRPLASCKIGLENCRSAGPVGITSLEDFRIMSDMLAIVGKKIEYVDVFVLNPMRVEGNEVDIALHLISEDSKTPVYVHSMPILGVTVPIHLSGAFVEATAAVISAAVIFDAITEAEVTFDISTVFPFDMKAGCIAYGTPQHLISFLMGRQINEFYGIKNNAVRSLLCNAAHCNPQANSLRAMQTICGTLSGFDTFCYGGMLGIDKVFSPFQLLIDIEIVRYAKDVAAGFGFNEEHLSIDAIEQVGPDGDFLTHPSTIANCHELLWNPLVFENCPVEKCTTDGTRIRAKINSIVKDRIGRHSFKLPDEQQRELDAIYERAKKVLLGQG